MPPGGSEQSLSQQIDSLRSQLAGSLKSDQPDRIEDLIAGWEGDERRELLRQLLGIEIEFRRSQLEDLSVDEFIGRFPDDAALVRIVFEQSEATIAATLIDTGSTSPQDFGEYTVLEKIGEGGMGAVFKARHKRMKRTVAIKLLPRQALDSPDAVKRFEREVEVAARLEHPNVVTAYDAGEAHGHHFLVMRYVDGQDLSAYVKQHGPLPVETAINYIAQAAHGLEYAHDEGIIHRDIKPSNLLLNRKGTVKILDLGLARLDSETDDNSATELTQTGAAMGTVDYMAPEQSADAHTADVRSDIYSLGCTLYYLLTGKAVYGGATLFNRMLAHREQPIPNLTAARPDIPPAVNDLFGKMVAKQPEDRYQSMTEVIAAIRACGVGNLPEPVGTASGSSFSVSTSAPVTIDGLAPTTTQVQPVTAESTTSETSISAINQQTVIAAGAVATDPTQQNRNRQVMALTGTTAIVLIALLVWFNRPSPTGQGDNIPANAVKPSNDKPDDVVAESTEPPAPTIAPFTPEEAKQHQQAWAKHLGLPVEKEFEIGKDQDGKAVNLTMVLIPPGKFLMGSTPNEQAKFLKEAKDSWAIERIPSEGPQHRVRITKPFYLGKYEVTQAQWQSVMGGNPSNFKDNPTHPVEQVSWADIQPFLSKLNEGVSVEKMTFALPTEAQWEHACRAGTTTPFYGGESATDLEQHGWSSANADGRTHPAGDRQPNAFGIYDMQGNVWEWCADIFWQKYYGNAPKDDPSGPVAGSHRVNRGGGWSNHPAYSRSAFRSHNEPDYHHETLGFRLAATIDAQWETPTVPKKTVNTASEPGYALHFDGEDDHVEIPTMQYDGSHPLTIEAYVKPQGLGTAPAVASIGHVIVNINHGRKLWNIVSRSASGGGFVFARPETAVELGRRIHICGMWDGKDLTLFIDGRLLARKPVPGGLLFSNNPLYIAADPSGNNLGGFFIGTIDELRISSVARYTDGFTPQQRFEADQQTLALYHFEEGSGDLLRDSSGNDHHGRIFDARWIEAHDPNLKHERAAAEWVLGIGGTIQTDHGNFKNIAKLPEEAFTITTVGLVGNQQVKDDDLQRITRLAQLQKLNLESTQVTSAGLEHVHEMKSLTDFSAVDTQIDNAGLKQLESLANLKTLNLARTQVTDNGLQHLQELTKLQALRLDDVRQVGSKGLVHLRQMTGLSILDLSGTDVNDTGMRYLKALTNLTSLDLSHTKVGDPGLSHLSALAKLDRLDLRHTQVTPLGIVDLEKILPGCDIRWDGNTDPDRDVAEWVLEIGGSFVTDQDENKRIRQLEELPAKPFRITGAYVDRNKRLTNADLARFSETTALTQFLASHSPGIGDAGLEHIKGLNTLEGIHLHNTRVTDAGLKHLSGLKNLTYIGLVHTRITDRGIAHIKDLPRLTNLGLSHTAITDDALGQLANTKTLTSLILAATNVTDTGLKHLSGLTDLSILGLDETNITDTGLQTLKNNKKLTQLNLSGTKVTPAGIADLQKALPNCKITGP